MTYPASSRRRLTDKQARFAGDRWPRVVAAMAAIVIAYVSSASAQLPFPAAADVPGTSAALSSSPPYQCVTNHYVDGANGNDAGPGSQAKPWKTIQNADNGYPNRPVAGECINVLPGTYALTSTLILGRGGNSNAPTGYVVYRSTVPQAAHLIAQGGIAQSGNGDLIMLTAPYVIVDGFEVDGNHALTAGHGIDGCAGGGGPLGIAHHIIVINNIVHDMGGAGLSSCTADYIIWRNNLVYDTSSTSRYQASGLSVWKPQALAAGSYAPADWDKVEYGIEIAYNIARDNGEGPSIPGDHTDGNGIIIDTTLGSADCPTCGAAYPGKILVIGNLSHDNGGGGIHVFLSKNVVVAHNTVYNNYLDTRNPYYPRGELSNLGSSNMTWVNNIAIAKPGNGILAQNEPIVTEPISGGFQDSGIWKDNIAYGASVTSDATSNVDPATNMIGVDPKLANPPGGDFHPLSGSPAIGAGLRDARFPTLKDNDIGAY